MHVHNHFDLPPQVKEKVLAFDSPATAFQCIAI